MAKFFKIVTIFAFSLPFFAMADDHVKPGNSVLFCSDTETRSIELAIAQINRGINYPTLGVTALDANNKIVMVYIDAPFTVSPVSAISDNRLCVTLTKK